MTTKEQRIKIINECLEALPKETDLEGLYAEGWNTCCRATKEILNKLKT
jgi:hypothetical protein